MYDYGILNSLITMEKVSTKEQIGIVTRTFPPKTNVFSGKFTTKGCTLYTTSQSTGNFMSLHGLSPDVFIRTVSDTVGAGEAEQSGPPTPPTLPEKIQRTIINFQALR